MNFTAGALLPLVVPLPLLAGATMSITCLFHILVRGLLAMKK